MKAHYTAALAMRGGFGLGAIAVGFLSGCLTFALWLPMGTATANEVTDWNIIISQADSASGSRPGNTHSGRNVALMHLAMHDALNAITRRYDFMVSIVLRRAQMLRRQSWLRAMVWRSGSTRIRHPRWIPSTAICWPLFPMVPARMKGSCWATRLPQRLLRSARMTTSTFQGLQESRS